MRRTATNLKYGRGCAYDIQYHIIFVTKYRKNVLTKQIRQECINLMHNLSADCDYSIIEANGEEDHIHLLIEATPLTDIPSMIKQLKGVTARLLFKDHPEIKKQLWDGHLWSPSYFIATASERTSEQIKEYIRKQGQKKKREKK